jgi:hypothetical protein
MLARRQIRSGDGEVRLDEQFRVPEPVTCRQVAFRESMRFELGFLSRSEDLIAEEGHLTLKSVVSRTESRLGAEQLDVGSFELIFTHTTI